MLRQDSRGEREGWGAGSSREACSCGKGIGSTGAAVPRGEGGQRQLGFCKDSLLGWGDYSSPSQESRKLSEPCGIQFSASVSPWWSIARNRD